MGIAGGQEIIETSQISEISISVFNSLLENYGRSFRRALEIFFPNSNLNTWVGNIIKIVEKYNSNMSHQLQPNINNQIKEDLQGKIITQLKDIEETFLLEPNYHKIYSEY